MKKSFILLTTVILSLILFSCKKNDCSKNNTGSIFINNDADIMPGTADFYRGTIKLASLAKGGTAKVDNVPVGSFIMTVKMGADTIYDGSVDLETIEQCKTLNFNTSEKFVSMASDKRLKKNILPIQNALSEIGKLKLYSYEYNAPENYSGYLPSGKHYGFIAQELKEIYPTFVQLNSNNYYSVNYQEMIPILVKGIQEQQAQIDELKKEMTDLKSLVKNQQSLSLK